MYCILPDEMDSFEGFIEKSWLRYIQNQCYQEQQQKVSKETNNDGKKTHADNDYSIGSTRVSSTVDIRRSEKAEATGKHDGNSLIES